METLAKKEEDQVKKEEDQVKTKEDHEDTKPQEDQEDTKPPKAPTVCGVCETEVAKYKCAQCPLAYCSVACSRVHRENHPVVPKTESNTPSLPDSSPVPVKKKEHPFSILDDNPELNRLFDKYPKLTARLGLIVEQTLPPANTLVSGGMHWSLPAAQTGNNAGHGGGRRGKGKGGRGGRGGRRGGGDDAEPKPQPNRPWTKEMGLRKAVKALRKARIDSSEDGDGVREYCELVLHLLERGFGEASVEQDFTASVRKEVEEGDAALVQQLMKADGDL